MWKFDFFKKILKVFVGLFLGISLFSGCTTENPYPPATQAPPMPPPSVTLQPGDEIEIKFFYTPELDVTQVIRVDGKISLQIIGEIEVEGKSPTELRDELLELYKPHLKDPEINVIVRSVNIQRVLVDGEINRPGVVEIRGKLTALDAIIQAGGFRLPEAKTRNIIVVRNHDGERKGYSLDLRSMLEKGQEVPPFYLQPLDVVYVPRTTITKIDQWVDQYINRLIPRTPFDLDFN